MESKAFVPETTSYVSSNSPGSSSFIPIRASPSYDSDVETVSKTNGLKFDYNKGGNSSSSSSSISSSSSSNSDDGFLSGGEEFETASERPFVADPDEDTLEQAMEIVVDEDDDENFVESFDGSSDFSRTAMPIAKVSSDDDDDEEEEIGGGSFDVVESPKVRVLVGEEIGVGGSFDVGYESFMGELGSGSILQEISESPEFETTVSEVIEAGLDEQVKENSIEVLEKSDAGGNEATVEKFVVEAGSDEPMKTNSSEVLAASDEPMKANSSEVLVEGDVGGIDEAIAEKLVVEDGDEVFEYSKLIESRDSEAEEGSGFVQQPVESSDLKHEDVEKGNKYETVVEAEPAAEDVKERSIVGGGIDELSSNGVEPVADKVVNLEAEGAAIVENRDSKVEEADVPNDEVSSNGLEPVPDKVVNLTPGGDMVVENLHVDLSVPGAVVVGDLVENKASGMEVADVLIDGIANVDNEFDLIGHDGEEPAESKLTGVGSDFAENGGPVTSCDVKTSELESLEQNTDVADAGKDENVNTEIAIAGALGKDGQDVSADESKIVEQFNGEGKSATGFEPEADSDVKQNESVVKLAADGAEILSTDRVVGRDGGGLEGVYDVAHSVETKSGAILEAEDETAQLLDEEGEIEGSDTDGDTDGMIFGSSEAAKKFLEELEQGSAAGSHSGAESSHDHSQRIDGQIVTDSDEEVDTDEEGEGKQLFDSAALAALLKAATGSGSDDGNITITSQDGSRIFSVERPAGLGSSLRSVKPAPRPNRSNLFTPSQLTTGGDSESNLSEEEKKKLENIQLLTVKFLRLVWRLGHSSEDSVAAQVLYRLALVAGRPTSSFFSLDAAKQTALQLETDGKDELNFSLNILVLGKAGVGKSATINSIFGEEKTSIDAFAPATTTLKEITGVVDGVMVRVFDTPGLKSSVMEQADNRKILSSIKKFTKKCPPDIVLYVDRLDTQTRDLNDLPLLRTITSSLGPSIWRSAIVTLTHGASAPPDGPSGSPLSYEVFVAQRSHVVQQSIGQAVGDLRLMNPSLMNPVSLVENHPSCRKNRDGQKVLPNGQTWRPQLLLLCYSMKILSEASSISKPQDPFDHRKLFGFRVRSPPLPYLLSWLLQSRTHPKLPSDQGVDNGDSDIDLDDLSDSDVEEDGDEYDQLPPFKPLKKSHLAKLNKEQRKAYFEEYDYRVKLLQKKQWKEELKRMRESKKRENIGVDEYGYTGDDMDQEDGGPAAVPVALPDMALPPSFDSDNPAYRYRFLEPTSQLLTRPVLDTHGWDHDCGYDGVNLEQSLAIASQFPAAVAVQITKDKKEFNIHLDSSVSAKHGEKSSSMAGFDIQNIGKQLAYIVRGETKFKILKKNTTAAGFSVTFLGENVATGFKFEDQIAVGKRLILVGSTGTVRSQGDAAYGANVEVRLRESDYPIGQDQSTLGLSLVKWRGDLALGANLQSQFSIGRSSKMAVRVGLNNKLSGQITVRTTSSDQLQIALMGIIPVAMTIYKSIWPGDGENYSY